MKMRSRLWFNKLSYGFNESQKQPDSLSAWKSLVPGAGLEPARGIASRDFKSLASTSFATQAGRGGGMEATSGLEPLYEVLQTSA